MGAVNLLIIFSGNELFVFIAYHYLSHRRSVSCYVMLSLFKISNFCFCDSNNALKKEK